MRGDEHLAEGSAWPQAEATRLRATLDAVCAELDKRGSGPDRLLIMGHGDMRETHRRGDLTCTAGRCTGLLETCPACGDGMVHRAANTVVPPQCDRCGHLAWPAT